MAVMSPEGIRNIGQAPTGELNLPAGNVGESLRALHRAVKWKALEIATTHRSISTVIYKLGLIKISPLPGPECAFPVGHPSRVVGRIE